MKTEGNVNWTDGRSGHQKENDRVTQNGRNLGSPRVEREEKGQQGEMVGWHH